MQDAPNVAALSTECPPELTDPEARNEWQRAIVPAIERGQITLEDRGQAIGRCELWARYRQYKAEADRHPLIVAAGRSKFPMVNPAGKEAVKTLMDYAKACAELGQTPTARARIHIPKDAPVNALKERYFGGRGR
jgi:P27 family predicted phage terminase small subunit